MRGRLQFTACSYHSHPFTNQKNHPLNNPFIPFQDLLISRCCLSLSLCASLKGMSKCLLAFVCTSINSACVCGCQCFLKINCYSDHSWHMYGYIVSCWPHCMLHCMEPLFFAHSCMLNSIPLPSPPLPSPPPTPHPTSPGHIKNI